MLHYTLIKHSYKQNDSGTDPLLSQKQITERLRSEKELAKKTLSEVTFAWREEMLKLREQKAQVQLDKLNKRQEKLNRLDKIEQEIIDRESEYEG